MRPFSSPSLSPQSGSAARRGDRTRTNLRLAMALRLRRAGLAATLLLLGSLTPASVSAQTPFPTPAELLQQALDSQWNLDVSAAANAQTLADADISLARARLLPSLSVAGTWTLNQDEVSAVVPSGPDPGSLDEIVFTRRNQLETVFSVDVPLLDLQNRASVQLASAQQAGATASADVVVENLAASLLQAWFQAVVADAVIEQSEQTVASAEQTLQLAMNRRDAGLGTDQDVLRAQADLAGARGTLADAELAAVLARRAIRTLSGVEIAGSAPQLEATLEPEADLSTWLVGTDSQPIVAAALQQQLVAQARTRAATMAWAPTVDAFAQERITNAGGFNPPAFFSAGLRLNWSLSVVTPRFVELERVGELETALELERARRQVEDRIHDAWHTVAARRSQALAAREQALVANDTARTTRERFANGTATQLDVSQADRDAFVASLRSIAADNEWLLARALLRLRAGMALEEVIP